MLKNKIQLGKYEDLIGFIQLVMNQTAWDLVNSKDLQRTDQRKGV